MIRIPKYALLLAAMFAMGAPAQLAEAQCRPGSAFCADVQGRRGGRATISVGRRRARVRPAPPAPTRVVVQQPVAPPPPARVVVVQQPVAPPPQRVVVVQQQQPPPPQRVVVVQQQQPPPPQRVVVVQPQPQPQQQVVVTQPQRPQRVWRRDPNRPRRFGVHGQLSVLGNGNNLRMAGLGVGFRIRPIPRLAVDIGVGVFGGTDYVGNSRVEVPMTVDALFFFNPRSRAQVYAVAGVGGSVAYAENGFGGSRDFAYVGGQAGLGLEFRVSRPLAINVDVRGFLRHRVDSDPRPEFVEDLNPDPTVVEIGRTTDTSGGATVNVGATLYF